MKITQVEFRKLVTGEGYNNEAFGVFADVEPGETPEEAKAKAVAQVEAWHLDERIEARREYRETKQALDRMEWQTLELEREIVRKTNNLKRLVNFEQKICERLGVKCPIGGDDIPF